MRRLLGITSVMLLVLLCIYGYNVIIIPPISVKQMMSTLHANGAQMGLLGSAIYYPIFIFSLFMGPLIDRIKSRYVGSISALFIASGAVVLSKSYSYQSALIGTVIFGIGVSTGLVLMFYSIKQWLNPRWYALYISCAMALSNLSIGIMTLVFTNLLKVNSWHQLFEWMAWFGFGLTILIFIFVSNNEEYHDETAPQMRFHDGFLILVKNSEFWKVIVIAFLLYLPMAVFVQFWSIAFLKDANGFPAQFAAHAYSLLQIGLMLGTICFGLCTDLLKRYRGELEISIIACLILVICIIYIPQLGATTMLALFFLFGFMMGSTILPFYFAAKIAPKSVLATALSLTIMASYLGNVIFIQLIGKILDSYWTGEIRDHARIFSRHAFEVAFVILPAAYVLAFIVSLLLKPIPKN